MDTTWIKRADYISGYKIEIEFNNGKTGLVDLKNQLREPIFQPLREKEYFKNFKLNSWTIEWENGADFAPEFLYDLLKEKHEV